MLDIPIILYGCGKSTLLRCCALLLTPQGGEVLLGNEDLASLSARQLGQRPALLPQQHLVPEGMSVQKLACYGRSPWLNLFGYMGTLDSQRVQAAIEQTQVTQLATQQVCKLSGRGRRQRAFLAMALAQDTQLLLLNEPTT